MTGPAPVKAPRQLPLDLGGEPDYSRDSFVRCRSNADALGLIDRWPDWPAPLVVLSGPEGSGKTHLARIWSAASGAAIVSAGGLTAFGSHDALDGGACVVEDVPPEDVPEHALFHLINAAREAGAALLITSRLPPASWKVAVPDLASRLRLAAPLSLDAPDDALLRQVLVKLFADRQLEVEKSVVDYMVLRMERSLGAARRLVAALDGEALSRGRRINRATVAAILARAGQGFPDAV